MLLADLTSDGKGHQYCIMASVKDGLGITFYSNLSFDTPAKIDCVAPPDPTPPPGSERITVKVRVALKGSGEEAYVGARVECDLGGGIAYALLVEKADPTSVVYASATTQPAPSPSPRTIVVPWDRLHLARTATHIRVQLTICDQKLCAANLTTVIPVGVHESAGLTTFTEPVIARLSTPAPSPGTNSLRLHNVGFDATWGWDHHDLLSMSFAQDQGTVTADGALSQALGLTPIPLPSAPPPAQSLQSRGAGLFAFQTPSDLLEDPSLKDLFDMLPFAVSRIGSLSSGFAYGYASDAVKVGSFYGSQGPGVYNAGATLTLVVGTPIPGPEPTPTPTKTPKHGGLAPLIAVVTLPLKPPPAPAPFFESGTESVPPAQFSFVDAFTGGSGKRDNVVALAAERHLYKNLSATATAYRAETINFFGRLEYDYPIPLGNPNSWTSLQSLFAGESATFTRAEQCTKSSCGKFLQLRESFGIQQNDSFFAPKVGRITWLAPLSGPVAHVSASYAAGPSGRYFGLDFLAFRLTNVQGDIAAQAGWQASIPLFGPGWLLTGGALTQTASDRIAAIEQGLVKNYAAAVTSVLPTPLPNGPIPQSAIRSQRLENLTLISPKFAPFAKFKPLQALNVQVAGGFTSGTATGCAPTLLSPPTSPVYECSTANTGRRVGGIFLDYKKLKFGFANSADLTGNISAGAAAQNLGTGGALPGSVIAYISHTGCPRLSAVYTNAAFPPDAPLAQQGSTLAGEIDYPMAFAQPLEIGLGYFNEHTGAGVAPFGESGFFAIVRLTSTFDKTSWCAGQ